MGELLGVAERSFESPAVDVVVIRPGCMRSGFDVGLGVALIVGVGVGIGLLAGSRQCGDA